MITGLIFAAIAILWAAYLVPRGTRRDRGWVKLDDDSMSNFNASIQLVRDCSSGDSESEYQVSTPLIRRAVKYEIRRGKQVAARRRRVGLIGNTLIFIATIVLPFFTSFSHWITLGGALVLIAWLALSRYSVCAMDRVSKRILARCELIGDEPTVVIEESELNRGRDSGERSIRIRLEETLDSLLAPIPVTPTTYVSKPLLPRSVRTVDLSAPMVEQKPVTSARPDVKTIFDDEETEILDNDLPRAVGE